MDENELDLNADDRFAGPKATDLLFRSEKDFHLNACIGWMHDSHSAYADGFKSAAEILCDNLILGHGVLDVLVYPVCSMYRHYLELRMKEIIRDGAFILESHQGNRRHHNIVQLWHECRKIAEKLWPDGDGAVLDNLERLIGEFASVDPSSQDFRYPRKQDETRTLNGLHHINIRNLQEVMERASGILDGISYGTSEAKTHVMEVMSNQY